MLLALALAFATAAQAPSGTAQPPRVLVLETRADAAYLDRVKAFGDLLATVLEQRAAAEIVPSSSVKDRLAVAADKLQAGCDDTACMTEIAGALDARWVVASRASQVGGRWLMRVELFDGEDLKVVAQASAMSDSVEGLASQAEALADELLAKAPMLPRRDGSSSSSASTAEPAAAAPATGGPNGVALGVGAASSALAVGAAALGTWGWFYAAGKERDMERAREDYIDDPSVESRRAFAEAGRSADNASTLQNCVLLPIGCLCLPLGAVGVGGLWWGFSDDGGEP